ncbi:MAG: hypothetical protein JJT81_06705 [Rubellimicrobium sp.]|nr:hypothetical protein [Rubellimicrobium sp.]
MRGALCLCVALAATTASSDTPSLSFVTEAGRFDLSAKHLVRAEPIHDEATASWVVGFTLSRPAAQQFADLTGNAVGQVMGIHVCGRLVSEPTVRDRIVGGQGLLSADSHAEAIALAEMMLGVAECVPGWGEGVGARDKP